MRVIVLEPSHWDKTVFSHIRIGVMPLWTPFPAVSLNYTIDLLQTDRDIQGPVSPSNAENVFAKIGKVIQRRSGEVFDRIGTLETFLQNSRDFLDDVSHSEDVERIESEWDNTPLYGDLAGAAVLLNNAPAAVAHAERFIKAFERNDNPYFQERVIGMHRLAELAREDLASAKRLLNEWEMYTARQLKLEAFLDPKRWIDAGDTP